MFGERFESCRTEYIRFFERRKCIMHIFARVFRWLLNRSKLFRFSRERTPSFRQWTIWSLPTLRAQISRVRFIVVYVFFWKTFVRLSLDERWIFDHLNSLDQKAQVGILLKNSLYSELSYFSESFRSHPMKCKTLRKIEMDCWSGQVKQLCGWWQERPRHSTPGQGRTAWRVRQPVATPRFLLAASCLSSVSVPFTAACQLHCSWAVSCVVSFVVEVLLGAARVRALRKRIHISF